MFEQNGDKGYIFKLDCAQRCHHLEWDKYDLWEKVILIASLLKRCEFVVVVVVGKCKYFTVTKLRM